MARPVWQPTDAQRLVVVHLRGHGVQLCRIAEVVGVAEKTLRRRCAAELKEGGVRLAAIALQGAEKALRDGSFQHWKMYAHNVLGMSMATDRLELSGSGGLPLVPPVLSITLVEDDTDGGEGSLGRRKVELLEEAGRLARLGDAAGTADVLAELKSLRPPDGHVGYVDGFEIVRVNGLEVRRPRPK